LHVEWFYFHKIVWRVRATAGSLLSQWLFFLHYLTITTIHGNVGSYSPKDMTPNGKKA